MKRKIDYSELLLSGIYFLIHKREIVYVGKSDCIVRRIGEHVREGKKIFDNFKFFSSKTFFWMDSPKHRGYAEAKCIRKFKPKYNEVGLNTLVPFYSFKPIHYTHDLYRINSCVMGEFRCFGIKEVSEELGISMEKAETIFDAREDEMEEKYREWEKSKPPRPCNLPDIVNEKHGGLTFKHRPPTKKELGYP